MGCHGNQLTNDWWVTKRGWFCKPTVVHNCVIVAIGCPITIAVVTD